MPTVNVDPLAIAGLPNLMRLPQVLAQTGLSRSTIYKMMKAGEFPQPMKLGPAINGWRGQDIAKWMNELEE